MQATISPICSSSLPTTTHHSLLAPLRTQFSRTLLPFSHFVLSPCKTLRSTGATSATQEIVETEKTEPEFVEVGYISSVHGIHGEICIKPNTDFPELRFSKPGRRWLRQAVSGKQMIQEVELVKGRGNPGQKNWILRFGGIDTVDQAKQLVGSTLLVREDDRPELGEGEFYTRDLVGLRMILKETGECVGTVVQVFNTGASDILQVRLQPSKDVIDGNETFNQREVGESGPLVWVPFVEAIVPDVDMNKREMQITPPKGLLELNIRSDERSKKERRQLEWKERKRLQRRLIAAKKKLCEMEQKHVFHGLRFGEKSQRSLLADQIIGINSQLLQQALQNLEAPSKRWSRNELISAMKAKILKDSPQNFFHPNAAQGDLPMKVDFLDGLDLLAKGKVAIVLVINEIRTESRSNWTDLVDLSSENSLFPFLENSLFRDGNFLKIEDRASVPLILVGPEQQIESLKTVFWNNGYFNFDSNKVWFLEEAKVPVVSSAVNEEERHKILMKSPWEILQSPVGSGGVICSLSSQNILDNLSDMGVEYVEICSTSQKFGTWNSLLSGYLDSRKAEVGVQHFGDETVSEECFNMAFSINFLKSLSKQMDKLEFEAIQRQSSHVQLVDKKWEDIVPTSPNSYELYCSIYSFLNSCPLDRICVLQITE
ncbi:hypothetical protein K2173_006538 [Erythroxylum novogranatense]|uniref:Uncharacterized protein n=1 Tax=Erythroxylum novogranatense TaxID=1862640 RepID=A0AAV8T567_9ROSI|nr:hypothetical protein K2173_006538 [Erythroxylum novogranatense]